MLTTTHKNTYYKIPLKYHFLFWSFYFLLNFIRWGSYFDDYWYSLKSNLVEFPIHIIITYFNLFYLIPKYILTKKYFAYFTSFTLLLTFFYCIRTALIYYLITKNIWPEAEGMQKAFTFNHFVAVVLGEIYVVAFVSVIKLTSEWTFERKRNEELKEAQLRSELNFLKTQIQPHFFFNTLNNLYALALEKSNKTPEVILKLSEIMQYVLYDAKSPEISLLKEINYLLSYLELEKLRYGDTIKSELNVTGNINNITVPPLLFLPFIENCFKHGAKNNDNTKLTINFEKNNAYLFFRVTNNFNLNYKADTKHGIGIENVNRRLKLLYNDNFSLQTTVTNSTYAVYLKLPLK